jgi:hypothetical protein
MVAVSWESVKRKKIVVAGGCNHPKLLELPLSLELLIRAV